MIKEQRTYDVDPFRCMDTPQARLFNFINVARANKVNEMITEHIPGWKVYLLKKSKLFARMFGIFTVIEPQPMLESDVIREKLILCKGSKEKPKQIAEMIFFIQDKRKIM